MCKFDSKDYRVLILSKGIIYGRKNHSTCTDKISEMLDQDYERIFPISDVSYLMFAEKRLGKRGKAILMADGSQVEELDALRENDHLYIL